MRVLPMKQSVVSDQPSWLIADSRKLIKTPSTSSSLDTGDGRLLRGTTPLARRNGPLVGVVTGATGGMARSLPRNRRASSGADTGLQQPPALYRAHPTTPAPDLSMRRNDGSPGPLCRLPVSVSSDVGANLCVKTVSRPAAAWVSASRP